MIKVTLEVETQEEFEFAYQKVMGAVGEVCDGVFGCLVSIVKTSPPHPPLLLRGGVLEKSITVEDVSLEMMQDDTTPILDSTKEFFEMRSKIYAQHRKSELEALNVSERVRIGGNGLCNVLNFLGKKGNI